MKNVTALIAAVEKLSETATLVSEEAQRLRIGGDSLDENTARLIEEVFAEHGSVGLSAPILRLNDELAHVGDLRQEIGSPWVMLLGKAKIAEVLHSEGRETFFFYSVKGFTKWVDGISPFEKSSYSGVDFSSPILFRVAGLPEGFGGYTVSVLPLQGSSPVIAASSLPVDDSIHRVVHLINSDGPIWLSPQAWSLTWGELNQPAALAWLRLSCLVLSACIASEVIKGANGMGVTVRGAKTHRLGLWQSASELSWERLQRQLMGAVSWIYEERAETRLKLLLDRLSIDLDPSECWLSILSRYVDIALKQAKDSYAFVISDRKDAYYKEMREVMKDMKSQADLFAAKVRDLVGALTRDILGVLVFLAFSFVAKFDQKNIDSLLHSAELAVLLRFLAGYLVISCILQLGTHFRDASLAYGESVRWLSVLRNYTSSSENEDSFLKPIKKRRSTLWVVMAIVAIIYIALAVAVWFLPEVADYLLCANCTDPGLVLDWTMGD